jgi:hypothetical protein
LFKLARPAQKAVSYKGGNIKLIFGVRCLFGNQIKWNKGGPRKRSHFFLDLEKAHLFKCEIYMYRNQRENNCEDPSNLT